MDNYEISIWEDYSVEDSPYLHERKIAVIGSDSMRKQNIQIRALEPNLVEEINGCNTFTFKMHYTYTDTQTGEKCENPFCKYLINERKIKVHWKEKWYDLVIKQCQEDTSQKIITYTCKDLFINELSKQGYSLEFNTELQNNIGTVEELAIEVLKGSTWQYDSESSEMIIQRTEGPVYEVITNTSDFFAIKSTKDGNTAMSVQIPVGSKILVFYDSLVDCFEGAQNQMIQFLYAPEGYITDVNDSLVINGDCYYIMSDCIPNGAYLDIVSTDANHTKRFSVNFSDGVSERYRAKRWVRSQQTEYDPLLDSYVLVCTDNNGNKIYEIATTEYSNPLAVINLVANPTEFTNTAGWIGKVEEFGLYPKFSTTSSWDEYKSKSYLKIKSGDTYNTGIQSNIAYFQPTDIEIKAGRIGGIQKGEKYIFRYKAKENPNSNNYITSGILANLYKFNDDYTKKGDPVFTLTKLDSTTNWAEFSLVCNKAVSADEIKDYGLFLSTTASNSNDAYWIEDIQLFIYQEGVDSYDENTQLKRMEPNEISLQSYAQPVYKYYKADNSATAANELTYEYVGSQESNSYKPVYNNYQKIITIEEKESNRFNILQSIAETAQAWIKFRIDHDEDGAMSFDEEGIPQKFVYFVEEIGEETGISFEYGIDLKTISRTIDSDKLATKVIVNPNTNEYAPNGFCSIARSNQNYTKENFILNLDYYTQQNLLDENELNKDLYSTQEGYIGYYYKLHQQNKIYDDLTDELLTKNMDLTRQEAQQEVYAQYLLAAQQQKEQIESDIINLAGVSQWSYAESYVKSHIDNEKVNSLIQAHGQVLEQINEYTTMYENITNSIQILKNYITEAKNRQNDILTNLSNIHKSFNDKYTNYIMEGTWQDENYIDADKYFLDGLNVAYTSSRPQLSYSINVMRLSSLEEYSSKVFHLGDICYMQDRDFFGYLPDKITPYKEMILVSKISSFFDQPEKDVLTIQNYKTRFDDLFQRIAATAQSLSYAEGSYARAAGAVNPDGSLSFAALQDSFDYNENLVLNSSNQNVTWDETGITVTNKLNSADQTKIIAGGIFVTNDGGDTWKNAVRGDGISTELLTAGRINTSEIYIYDGNSPSFRWDSYGLTAYAVNDNGSVNFNKFVRHDKYGIYGYDGTKDFVPSSEDSIWTNSKFGLTWKGFFLKSSGTSGIFEISTENDLVVKTKQENSNLYDERIKIGRVGKDKEGNDIYGIIIQNYEKENNKNVLKEVFRVDNSSATIAGWDMNSTSIEKNGVGLFSNGKSATIQGHLDNYYIIAGNNFGVTSGGNMYASAGKIGGWTITDSTIESVNSLNKDKWTKINSNGTLEGQIDSKTSWKISRDGFQFFDISGSYEKDDSGNQIILGNTKITNEYLYTSKISASGGSVGGCKIDSGSISGGTGWSLNSNGSITCSNITATGGTIGGCSITNGVLKIKDANIDSIKVSKLTDSSGTSLGASWDSINYVDSSSKWVLKIETVRVYTAWTTTGSAVAGFTTTYSDYTDYRCCTGWWSTTSVNNKTAKFLRGTVSNTTGGGTGTS